MKKDDAARHFDMQVTLRLRAPSHNDAVPTNREK